MRQFYLLWQKVAPLGQQLQYLSWSHYKLILPLKNISEIKYYLYIVSKLNLTKRELAERIKSKEYERIGYKEELKEPKINTLIKNPIIIKTDKEIKEVNEYVLHQLILENMDSFLKELGIGFTYFGSEFKIKIGNRYSYIDFLLFNYKFNCFVVVKLKVIEMKKEYVGQVMKYMYYADKYIKEPFNDKTVGIIICKREDEFILEYCSDHRIFTTTYELERSDTIRVQQINN